MSRRLGDSLPPALQERLSGRDLRARLDQAIPIATVDAEGRAHPAMLSYGEVVATDARTLRFVTYRDSATTTNLQARGAITLSLIEAGGALYVKARAHPLPVEPGALLARFEAVVEEVLADEARTDFEGAATITSGVSIRALDSEKRLAQGLALVEELRTAPGHAHRDEAVPETETVP